MGLHALSIRLTAGVLSPTRGLINFGPEIARIPVAGYTLMICGSVGPTALVLLMEARYTVKKYTIDPNGQVTKNKRNQSTFAPTVERSANAQKNAMPKEMISAHGIVRRSNPANRIPKALLAGEELKKFRIHGSAIEK